MVEGASAPSGTAIQRMEARNPKGQMEELDPVPAGDLEGDEDDDAAVKGGPGQFLDSSFSVGSGASVYSTI